MKNHKSIIVIGSVMSGLALVLLVYNFVNMYSLVAKCLDVTDTQQCQAYTNWVMLNKIGLVVLGVGVMIITIGILKRHQNKPS